MKYILSLNNLISINNIRQNIISKFIIYILKIVVLLFNYIYFVI